MFHIKNYGNEDTLNFLLADEKKMQVIKADYTSEPGKFKLVDQQYEQLKVYENLINMYAKQTSPP